MNTSPLGKSRVARRSLLTLYWPLAGWPVALVNSSVMQPPGSIPAGSDCASTDVARCPPALDAVHPHGPDGVEADLRAHDRSALVGGRRARPQRGTPAFCEVVLF